MLSFGWLDPMILLIDIVQEPSGNPPSGNYKMLSIRSIEVFCPLSPRCFLGFGSVDNGFGLVVGGGRGPPLQLMKTGILVVQ